MTNVMPLDAFREQSLAAPRWNFPNLITQCRYVSGGSIWRRIYASRGRIRTSARVRHWSDIFQSDRTCTLTKLLSAASADPYVSLRSVAELVTAAVSAQVDATDFEVDGW